MNHLIDEETANQIKDYIDSRNPYNLLRLVAPSIQYIRQNLDILPGKGHQMIFPWILIHALSFIDLQHRQYLRNRFIWFCWGRILIYAKTFINLGDSFRSKMIMALTKELLTNKSEKSIKELHEYFSFYALIVTSTPIITSLIMISIVRSRCFEWTTQNQSLLR